MKKRSTSKAINQIFFKGWNDILKGYSLKLLLALTVFLAANFISEVRAQYTWTPTIDGNKCSNDNYPSSASVTDPDDTSPDKNDILEVYFTSGESGSENFYMAFLRQASASSNSYIFIQFNVDGLLSTGDSLGSDYALISELKAGVITTANLFSWGGADWNATPTPITVDAKGGYENCTTGDFGRFIEIAIPYEGINYDVCSGVDLQLTKIYSLAGGSVTSAKKDELFISTDIGTFHINDSPTLTTGLKDPSGDVCTDQLFTISTTISDADSIKSQTDFDSYTFEVDTHYSGGYLNFDAVDPSAYTLTYSQENDTAWNLEFSFSYPTPGSRYFAIRVLDPWDCDLDVIDSTLVDVVANENAPYFVSGCSANAAVSTNSGDCFYTHSGTSWDVTATDDDPCGDPTVSYSLSGVTSGTGSTLDGVIFNKGITTVTWTASDGDPTHDATCSFTVTVNDTEKPVANCQNVTIYLDGSGSASVTQSQVDNRSTDNCGIQSLSLSKTSFNCDDTGSNIVTLTVTDLGGNTESCNATVTVIDNIKPVISNIPEDVSIECSSCIQSFLNSGFEEPVQTANSNNEDYFVSWGGSNSWIYWNEEGVPGWQTTAADGIIELHPSGYDNIASADGNQHAELNANYNSDLYQDFCTIPSTFLKIKFAHAKRSRPDNTDPDIMEVLMGDPSKDESTYTTYGPFTQTQNSVWTYHTIDFPVPAGQTMTRFIFRAVQGSTHTTSEGNLIDDVSVVTLFDPTVIPSASDNCSVELNLSEEKINSTCDDQFQLVRTWTAVDPSGNTATAEQVVTVGDFTKPDLFGVPADVTVSCDNVPALADVTATDNCVDDVSITFNEVRTDGACANSYTLTRTWTATDACSNDTTDSQVIIVFDTTAPTYSGSIGETTIEGCATSDAPTAVTTVSALEALAGSLAVSDNCSTDANMSVTSSDAVAGTCPIVITRTYTVTDECSNSVNIIHTIKIDDTTVPVVTAPVTTLEVECNDANAATEISTWLGTASATDNCDGSISVSNDYTGIEMNCNNVITVSFDATDACGNEAVTKTANIKIIDTTAPAYAGSLTTAIIEGCTTDDAPTAVTTVSALESLAGSLAISDNCSADTDMTVSSSDVATGTYPIVITRTYTVTDECDNETTIGHVINIVDNTKPVISDCPPDITVYSEDGDPASCSQTVTWVAPTGDDNCDGTITPVASHNPGDTFSAGTTTVSYIFTDGTGNADTCFFDVTVVDNTPPTFTCNDITVELDESDQYSVTEDDIALIVTDLEDNCSGIDGEISISLDTEVFTCATLGAQTVTVTVSDEAGNTATCDVTITVVDTIPPTITCSGDVTATIQSNGTCTGIVSVPSPTVSDNCGVASVINDFNSSSNASGNYPAGETVVIWTVTDNSGNTETCTQTINVIAEPQAINDSRSTPEDAPITISVLANDLDCDDNLVNSSLEITSDPTNGVVVVNSNGTVEYTPGTNYNGSDQFTYQICDADGQCDEATVTINVTPLNDPPVAVDDLNNTFVNQETTGKVMTNDYDIDGNSLSTTLQSDPSNGTLVFNTDGTYSYTPNAGYLGEDVFTYLLSDGQGGTDMASVYITVISDHSTANQPPVANEDAYVTKENVIVTGNMLENDYDPDGNPLVFNRELVAQPAVGTIQVFVDGSFEYIPEDGFTGQVNFTYEVCDDLSPAMCNTADVIIIIDPNANDNITVAVDDGFFTKVNSKLIRDVSANDFDPEGDNTTYSLKDAALHGTVSLNADGFFTYTPNADYIGPDQFSYRVCDDGNPSACDNATVYVNVSEVNHAPNAVDDWFNREDEAANVLDNDSDPDGDELVLNTTPVVDVTNGSLVINSDGTYIYTPDEFYFGLDSFTYEVCDNALVPLCDQATVVIFLDTDKDGAADVIDIDDDNDGILDVDEGDQTVDTDNDGIPDSLDIDSDNDGITDNEESQDENNYIAPIGTDSDGDGWDDAYDDDSGGTPIVIVDSDDDGSADFVDTDSDNDGIDDATEGHDANHDGVADLVPAGTDSDGDGLDDAYDTVAIGDDPVANVTGSNAPTDNSDGDQVSDYRDTDSDNDGLTDAEEVAQSNDPDNDGLANYLDIDSDGDGITDNQESQPEGAYVPPTGQDTDGDGIDDAYDPDSGGTPIASIDSDDDGDPDYLDEDSDNDSIPDSVEAHDADGDGVADTSPTGTDSDGDGLDDAYDTTNDFNDPLNVIGANTSSPNSDNDILSDWRDIDDDNDGILTSDEVNNSSDNDNDGVIDYLDIDSDNDGIVDNFEGQNNLTSLVSPTGIDSDGDGLDDAYDPDTGGTPIGFTDTDGDGIKDYLDEDSDNDHVPDYVEAQDTDKNGQPDIAYTDSDSDGDGLDDSNDNVAGTGNAGNSVGTNVPLQDSDGDGTPDWRDTDDDNDGIETSLNEDDNGDGDPTNDDCNYNGIPNYLDEESCDLLIPNGFSPNGDGINDYFRVRGIYQYPNANIEIYNRWGTKVFEKENFGNIPIYGDPDAWWDGRANVGGSSNSEILPSGTYFVVLILDGSTIHKGIVYINR